MDFDGEVLSYRNDSQASVSASLEQSPNLTHIIADGRGGIASIGAQQLTLKNTVCDYQVGVGPGKVFDFTLAALREDDPWWSQGGHAPVGLAACRVETSENSATRVHINDGVELGWLYVLGGDHTGTLEFDEEARPVGTVYVVSRLPTLENLKQLGSGMQRVLLENVDLTQDEGLYEAWLEWLVADGFAGTIAVVTGVDNDNNIVADQLYPPLAD
jgi:hypothetical protein